MAGNGWALPMELIHLFELQVGYEMCRKWLHGVTLVNADFVEL